MPERNDSGSKRPLTGKAASQRRIAKSALLLYLRMIFTLLVSLYICRVVLEVLGFEDYGIYNVVGGIVLLFSVISGSLTSAISRFLAFELGKNENRQLREIFSTALLVQSGMALILIFVIEIAGVWFLNYKLNIPPSRMEAANWVLQCSILTFGINLITIPYTAAIISREQMNAYAYISIGEALLKLLAVFLLAHITLPDKLKAWAVLLTLIALITLLLYRAYCRRRFEECSGKLIYRKEPLKQIMSFSGWNFIGTTSAAFRDHGVNILLNLFFGTVVNAARGISVQISSALGGFANNIVAAFNPQIIKSYASGNLEYMRSLVQKASRFSFYMLLILSIPVMIETPYVLDLFFKNVPEHTTLFVRLLLIFILSESVSAPLITSILATGHIRNYQIVVGGLQLLNLPVSYLFLRWGFFPEVTVAIAICCSFFCFLARIFMLRKPIGLSAWAFFRQTLIRVWCVAAIAFLLPLPITYLSEGFIRLVCTCIVSVICTLCTIYVMGCDTQERAFIKRKAAALLNKRKN